MTRQEFGIARQHAQQCVQEARAVVKLLNGIRATPAQIETATASAAAADRLQHDLCASGKVIL